MRRHGTGECIDQLVVLSGKAHFLIGRGWLPECAHDGDGFFESADGFCRCTLYAAVGDNAFPEAPGAKPNFYTAIGEDVEGGRGFGQWSGRPERQVEDVGHEPYMLCAGAEEGEQCPGVEEAGVVGVILDANKIQVCAIGDFCQFVGELQFGGRWVDVQTEEWFVWHVVVPDCIFKIFLESFDNGGDTLADADAHGGKAVFAVAPL